MKLKKDKLWKIVKESFEKEYGYPITEHISYDLIKFLVVCIAKEKK